MSEREDESYQRYYPNPARGLDTEAARRRVEANPGVMPPHPEPLRYRTVRVRERIGLRFGAAMVLFGAGFFLGSLARFIERRRSWHEAGEPSSGSGRSERGERFIWRYGNGPGGRRVLLMARR